MKPTPKNINAKVILSHSINVNLKDGTEVVVTGEVFDNPIYEIGERMLAWVHITYAKKTGLRYLAHYQFPMTEDELKDKIASIVEEIDHDDYKYSHIIDGVKK